jgi:hypothetical protein
MNNDTDADLTIGDSLKVEQNKDGTFTIEWDKNDPNWKFMNEMTNKEINDIINEAIRQDLDGPLSES